MISIAIPWDPDARPFMYPVVPDGAVPRFFDMCIVQTVYAIFLYDIAVYEIKI